MRRARATSGRNYRPRKWLESPQHLNLLHRAGAALLGMGLWVFGILGLVHRLGFFATSGQPIMGLSSNGLLSVISLVVGTVLIAAGLRGGRSASTVTVIIGVAFMLSGFANALVIGTSANVLAFGVSNVVFSEVAGGMLLILGASGRFTARLPSSNPYQQQRHPGQSDFEVLPTIYPHPEDVTSARELAEAERAVARRGATPTQIQGVVAARQHRRAEDRVESWRSNKPPRR